MGIGDLDYVGDLIPVDIVVNACVIAGADLANSQEV
jgi:hypothetical protein